MRLKNNKNIYSKRINFIKDNCNSCTEKGFSLTELSIALIIIGLIITATIGGKALIDQAKIISIINEFEEIKIALSTYVNSGGNLYQENGTTKDSNIFLDIKNTGIISASKLGYNPKEGNLYGYKTKLHTNKGTYLWYAQSKNSNTLNKYGQRLKILLWYGLITDGTKVRTPPYIFTLKFCKKLVHKLQSTYNEKQSLVMHTVENNKNDFKRFEFFCRCYKIDNSMDWNCNSSDPKTSAIIGVFVWDLK